ncbi:hypothetical protein PM082_008656 [Marasmius tenuissimus]|nr:hypothetical protein PM082_008656 [Marasmius tenuissimus]
MREYRRRSLSLIPLCRLLICTGQTPHSPSKHKLEQVGSEVTRRRAFFCIYAGVHHDDFPLKDRIGVRRFPIPGLPPTSRPTQQLNTTISHQDTEQSPELLKVLRCRAQEVHAAMTRSFSGSGWIKTTTVCNDMAATAVATPPPH